MLGAALDAPLSVAEIARRIGLGLTQQSVQRVANDVMSSVGGIEGQPQPSSAKLLAPTQAGRDAMAARAAEQHAWAYEVGAALGLKDLMSLQRLMKRIIAASRDYRAHRSDS